MFQSEGRVTHFPTNFASECYRRGVPACAVFRCVWRSTETVRFEFGCSDIDFLFRFRRSVKSPRQRDFADTSRHFTVGGPSRGSLLRGGREAHPHQSIILLHNEVISVYGPQRSAEFVVLQLRTFVLWCDEARQRSRSSRSHEEVHVQGGPRQFPHLRGATSQARSRDPGNAAPRELPSQKGKSCVFAAK